MTVSSTVFHGLCTIMPCYYRLFSAKLQKLKPKKTQAIENSRKIWTQNSSYRNFSSKNCLKNLLLALLIPFYAQSFCENSNFDEKFQIFIRNKQKLKVLDKKLNVPELLGSKVMLEKNPGIEVFSPIESISCKIFKIYIFGILNKNN